VLPGRCVREKNVLVAAGLLLAQCAHTVLRLGLGVESQAADRVVQVRADYPDRNGCHDTAQYHSQIRQGARSFFLQIASNNNFRSGSGPREP
jgi:hypothetical protein